MNSYQHANQLAYLLGLATWVDSPSEYVFGRRPSGVGSGGAVIVTDGPTADALKELRTPFALVGIGNSRPDDEHPDLLLTDFSVIVVQQVEGDPLGERALVGGPRPLAGGQGSSRGRGILEIEERVLAVACRLTGADGAPMALAGMGSPPSQRIDTGHMVSSRRYDFRAWCTRAAEYPAPTNLVATAAGGGTVNLSWTLPAARWDRRLVILRRAAGSTAPASATAGTGVTLSGATAASVSDTGLTPGTYSYAVFEAYTETGTAANERFSIQVTGTTRTVVAT